MEKFTKGEWMQQNGIVSNNLRVIASVNSSNIMKSEFNANAKLIAAAPELLHTLEKLLEQFKKVESLYSKDRAIIAETEVIIKKATE